jgi:methionyl-tRNA formyltransferase
MKKRIVIWCGNAPNQKALANKIAREFAVEAIVVENKPATRKYGYRLLLEKVLDRTFFRSIANTWQNLMKHYQSRYPEFPKVNSLFVTSINTDEVYEFTKKSQPDLIVVSGTSLIRKKLLSLQPSIGIINLHTGLSPYVKGGPNCTNWCIANNRPELIGNTIMWINAGIDSGNIITTRRTNISSCKAFFDMHVAVMEDAHRLYLEAIHYLLKAEPPHLSVDQKALGHGNLYLTRMWTYKHKLALLRNMKRLKKEYRTNVENIQTISLPPLPLSQTDSKRN